MTCGPPKFASRQTHDGGRGAKLQCRSMQIVLVILTSQFQENTDLTLLRLNTLKKFPRHPYWFYTSGISICGTILKEVCAAVHSHEGQQVVLPILIPFSVHRDVRR
jgi:hypothetical protein